jgi:hypothetical protein
MFVNGSGWDEQSLQRTFHRCFLSSFSSFGQAVSKEKILKNRPIRNKNCLWWPCLLMHRDEMSNLYRGPSIDASCQVSVHLAEGLQRRRIKCEKLTDDRRRTPNDGKSSHCLWQGELKINCCKIRPCLENYDFLTLTFLPYIKSTQTQFYLISSSFTLPNPYLR